MTFKELETKINEEIREKGLSESYDYLTFGISKVRMIVYNLIKQYIENDRIYVTDYKNNVVIQSYATNLKITIKVQKQRGPYDYRLYGSSYQYKIISVKIDDSEYATMEDFIKARNDIVNARENLKKQKIAHFKEDLDNLGISFKQFYELYRQFESFDYMTKEVMKKESDCDD